MEMSNDLYDVLGVERTASQDEVRRAFRRLAMEHHPDRNPDPKADQRFKEIAAAYEVLSDPEARTEYDHLTTAGDLDAGPASEGSEFGADATAIQCPWCGWQLLLSDVVCVQCNMLLGSPDRIGPVADRGRRLFAWLIDAFIVLLPAAIVSIIMGDSNSSSYWIGIGWVAGFAIWTLIVLMLIRRRQSPGKALLGISIVRFTGEPISAYQFATRQIGWWLFLGQGIFISTVRPDNGLYTAYGIAAAIVLLLNVGVFFISRNRQALHDKLFGTLVIHPR